ncbi:DUF5711 family protein [Clostridium formicaceticum]|uniref:Uncharacterized protein n=1 Tax=Clostridium formicaceticum TaxID=1497 RepID=A0AAC9RMN9_9CLOT|nr:DUF5711 family protein [Clostridium formicaceticum]AOY75399.1 hypothetical protein BJL90_05470 [Clostridium formicaceticum]ARE89854.1 hypothetical protein CLFO_43370 [Clostridium formicaceticum]
MINRRKKLSLLIVMILVLLSPQIIKNIRTAMTSSEKVVYLMEEIETSHSSDIVYGKLEDGVVQYWDGILYFYDTAGVQKWNLHLGIVNPILKAHMKDIYVVDNNKNQLIRVGKGGEVVYRYTMEDALSNFKVEEDNYVLLQYPTKNNMTELIILDDEGRKHGSILLGEGQVLNMSISKAHDLIAINTIMTKNSLESHLLTYDLKGQLIASNYLEEEFILDFSYDAKGNLIAVKEKEIIGINRDNKVVWNVFLEKVKLFKDSPLQHMVVYSGEESRNRLIYMKEGEGVKVVQYDGKIAGKTKTEEALLGIDTYNGEILLYSLRTIYLIDKKANVLVEYKYSSDIEEVFVFSKGHVAVVTKGKLSFLRILEA